jgi:hypothetical protein
MLVKMVVFCFAMTHRSTQYVVGHSKVPKKDFESFPLDPQVKKNVLGAKSFRIDEVASCQHIES